MTEPTETRTLVDAVLDEVERVSAKRERWRGYAQTGGSPQSYAPALMMMTMAIDAGKRAVSEDDGLACMAALSALKDFNDDD